MRSIDTEIIGEVEELERIMKDAMMRIDRISETFSSIYGQLAKIHENTHVIQELNKRNTM